MSEVSDEIDISDFILLDGVGPAAKKELKSGGFETITEIVACLPEELAERCGINIDKSTNIVNAANKYLRKNKLLDNNIMSGLDDLKRREALQKIDMHSEK